MVLEVVLMIIGSIRRALSWSITLMATWSMMKLPRADRRLDQAICMCGVSRALW